MSEQSLSARIYKTVMNSPKMLRRTLNTSNTIDEACQGGQLEQGHEPNGQECYSAPDTPQTRRHLRPR